MGLETWTHHRNKTLQSSCQQRKKKSPKKERLELRQLEQVIRDLRDDKTLLECGIELVRDNNTEAFKRIASFNLKKQKIKMHQFPVTANIWRLWSLKYVFDV